MKLVKKFLSNLRRTKVINWLELNFLSYLAWLIIQCVSRTVKIYKINFEKVKLLNKNVIYAFFHGEQFLLIFTHRNKNITIMTSYSYDGELQTRILKKFGYDIVRGSAKKKGATSGTLTIIDKLYNGQDCAFAVDGPHGPAFKVKPGVIYLAYKTGLPIIPVRVVVKRKIQFNNWDKYILPLPFTKAYIIYGEPFYVGENDSIKTKTEEFEKILKSLIKTRPNAK